jgi:uncharacterized protein (DUF736 family)
VRPIIACIFDRKKMEDVMIIGGFSYDAESDTYRGDVATLTFQRSNIELRPVAKSTTEEPDYRIAVRSGERTVEIGAAWKRTSEKGQEFLSVLLDDPALSGALNAALFLDEGRRSATLVWRRKKPENIESARASQSRAAFKRSTRAA